LELIVVMSIITLLALLTAGGWKYYRGAATKAVCSSNLRQLGTATMLYCNDHAGLFPPYKQTTSEGTMWYFGLESSSAGAGEGDRDLDQSLGPLYPYIEEVGKIEVCPGFDYSNALWKPKYKGASYGYGYNWLLGGTIKGNSMNISQLSTTSGIILFADCGQVNTFQPPASSANPMMEEFYEIDQTSKTIHFRHNNHANVLFVDGHVEIWAPYPGTEDRRVKDELFGRLTPVGSTAMLK
jgi:prepilin-type processing-associated H-X9-DG protein